MNQNGRVGLADLRIPAEANCGQSMSDDNKWKRVCVFTVYGVDQFLAITSGAVEM